MDAVTPNNGSIGGHTFLTIVGDGFPSIDDIEVEIGSIPCDVDDASTTEIICVVLPAGTTHLVDNSGTDPCELTQISRVWGKYTHF